MNNHEYEEVLKILSRGDDKSKEFLRILDSELSMPNLKMPTAGGHVFWTNLVEYRGWKLQQNDITHHARILNNKNERVAWGTVNGMYRAMDRLVKSAHRYELSSTDRLGLMDELKKLKELYDEGILTEKDYEEQRSKILKKL